jgi:4-hydroxythreonine-4-phosphate dehydrogenase
MKPKVAITMGDPVGVGPEIVLKALASRKVRRAVRPVVLGDEHLLGHIAGKLKLPLPPTREIINLSNLDPGRLKPGRPSKNTAAPARAMIAYIEEAVRMATSGKADAIVTAPIGKEAAQRAGFKFPGHTEFLAHLTGTKDFAMMLGGEKLKVVLVTIHQALADVPKLITSKNIIKTLMITDRAFKIYFKVKRPRIAVAGLNPHAGEGGLFGREEKKIIIPAVKKARALGINATGPLPADTVFYRAVKGEFDCVVCMYHDQGLGPLKLLHFDDGVNVTLGLPIIRTSVDHGTAYDIAWRGVASPTSLISAILTAADMSQKKT